MRARRVEWNPELEKFWGAFQSIMYMNDGTSVHGVCTTLIRGWPERLGMRSLDIASHHTIHIASKPSVLHKNISIDL